MGYSQNIIADSKNDWEKEGLKGKVKSKIRESYTQDSIGGPVISQQEEARYNELGRHTYDSFDFGSYFYKYDDMGRIIEKNYYNSYGRLSSNLTFKYNERSNSFEMSGIEDKMFKSLTTTFDARGKKTQEKSYTGPLEKIIWTVSRYDDKSNKIEQSKYKADGSLEYKETYQYDDKSNKMKVRIYRGSLDYEEINKYDIKGRIIERRKYVEIVLVDEVIDGKGVIVEEIGAINWVYDEEGKCVEEIRSGDYAFSHKVYKVIVKYEYYHE